MTVLRTLSFGAGQQSTALLLASIKGLRGPNGYAFPKIDHVIFADTGSERRATYQHVENMTALLGEWDVPFLRVQRYERSLGWMLTHRDELRALRAAGGEVPSKPPQIPAFARNAGDGPGYGKLMRDCSHDLKSTLIDREVLRLQRAYLADSVEVALGYDIQEVHRMKTHPHADRGWSFIFPLIEARANRGWSQNVCKSILGYVPPNSMCTFCPFRGARGFRELQREAPEDFAEAVAVDAAIRDYSDAGVDGEAFLSRFMVPLPQLVAGVARQGELFEPIEACVGECRT